MTRQVRFNKEIWDVISETVRSECPEELATGATLFGMIMHIRNVTTGESTTVYPWDVWGLEDWENLDGTCDWSKVPRDMMEED